MIRRMECWHCGGTKFERTVDDDLSVWRCAECGGETVRFVQVGENAGEQGAIPTPRHWRHHSVGYTGPE